MVGSNLLKYQDLLALETSLAPEKDEDKKNFKLVTYLVRISHGGL